MGKRARPPGTGTREGTVALITEMFEVLLSKWDWIGRQIPRI